MRIPTWRRFVIFYYVSFITYLLNAKFNYIFIFKFTNSLLSSRGKDRNQYFFGKINVFFLTFLL